MVKIFVGGLTSSITGEELRKLFEKYGQVNECDVLKNYAFVHMEKENEANKAISELHKHNFRGTSLTVEYATSKIRNATKIYVGNVSSKANTSDIKALFEKYGRVLECDIVKNYAFVHMAKERDAMDAITNLNDHPLEGQKIFVTLSNSNNSTRGGQGGPVPPPPPPPPGYFFRGRMPPSPPPSYTPRSWYDREYERYAYDLYDRAARSVYDRALSAPPLAAELAAMSAAASAMVSASQYRDRSPVSRRPSTVSQYADPYSISQGYSQSYSQGYPTAYSQYSVGGGYSAEDYYERYSNGYANQYSHSY